MLHMCVLTLLMKKGCNTREKTQNYGLFIENECPQVANQ